MSFRICEIEGCLNTSICRNWCRLHYVRWQRHGDANYKKSTLRERFDNGYTKKSNGCWDWNGSKDNYGYGFFSVGKKMRRVHRVSWNLYNGEILNGLYVLHKCDNPSCVNPDHLFLGTQQDNMRDRAVKGRNPDTRGCKNGRAKLKEDDIIEIRKLLLNGETRTSIAVKFNVSTAAIRHIDIGKTWSNIK